MKDEGKALFFYILSLVAMVWFIIWCIADFADANGFIMVNANFKNGRVATAFFGLFTSILMLAVGILCPINVGLFWKR